MYLWNINNLLKDLKENPSAKTLRVYTFMGPLLSLSIIALWVALLASHLFLADVFKHFIAGSDQHIDLYTTLGILTGLGLFLFTIASIYLCYKINKKGDGTHFGTRIACISAFITIHILLYTCALVGALAIISFIIIAGKAVLFSQEVQTILDSNSFANAIHETLENSPFKGIVQKSIYQEGLIGALLNLPSQLINLPLVFEKLEVFIHTSRTILLGFYPMIICIPIIMAYAYYTISYRCFKLMHSS